MGFGMEMLLYYCLGTESRILSECGERKKLLNEGKRGARVSK